MLIASATAFDLVNDAVKSDWYEYTHIASYPIYSNLSVGHYMRLPDR